MRPRAIITGASSGIGKALGYRLAKEDIELTLVARNKEALQDLCKKIPHATYLQLDLTKKQDVEKLVSSIQEQIPDYLFNNAGFGLYGEVVELSGVEQEEILELNCRAVLTLSREMARTLKGAKKPGVILNVSSAISFMPCPLSAVYAASKAFVTSFSEALDEEMREYGIRVLVSCPGQVATAFRERASKNWTKRQEPDALILDVDQVADSIWQQVLDMRSLQIVDWRYRLLIALTRLLPKRWVLKILKSSLRKRIIERIGPQYSPEA